MQLAMGCPSCGGGRDTPSARSGLCAPLGLSVGPALSGVCGTTALCRLSESPSLFSLTQGRLHCVHHPWPMTRKELSPTRGPVLSESPPPGRIGATWRKACHRHLEPGHCLAWRFEPGPQLARRCEPGHHLARCHEPGHHLARCLEPGHRPAQLAALREQKPQQPVSSLTSASEESLS